MEMFSEIYGCYFTVVSRILEQARNGLTKAEIEQLIKSHGFYDSTFYLLSALFSGEWNLLYERDKKYYSKLAGKTKRPLTIIEKSWLKALFDDPRIKLFLDEPAFNELKDSINDIVPLFINNDFYIYDQHLDGDNYDDPGYISRFKTILIAIKEQRPLIIEYDSPKGGRTKRQYHPYKLCYSVRDDKFRLQCAAFHRGRNQLQRITLNLGRITSVQISDNQFSIADKIAAIFKESICAEPVVLEISKERNALERCMLQFASFERQTEYDKDRDIYTCRIWFDPADETELLIRILSFGPVVRVLGPDNFLKQVKERIGRQIELTLIPAFFLSTRN